MDFFQFLQKSKQSTNSNAESDTKNDNDTNKNTYKKSSKKHNNKNEITNEITNGIANEITNGINKITNEVNEITNTTNETGHVLYKNVKKGNMVRIIYNENSILNLYKGYIGEIRDYKKEHDFAIVFLHGINSQTFIKCPLQHFIVL